MHDGDISPIGHAVPHIKSDEILDERVAVSGYRRPKRKHIGRGMAMAQWLPLGGEGHAFVAIDGAGRVTVSTAMLDQGAGTYTAMRQVAAEELQVPLEKVRVATLDTSKVRPGYRHRRQPRHAHFRQCDPLGGARRRKSNCSTLRAPNSVSARNSFL